jgi:hypothetical protein
MTGNDASLWTTILSGSHEKPPASSVLEPEAALCLMAFSATLPFA